VSLGVEGGFGVSSFLSVCLDPDESELIEPISAPTKENAFNVGEIENGNALSVGEGVSRGNPKGGEVLLK
jgi:hypothetical protein